MTPLTKEELKEAVREVVTESHQVVAKAQSDNLAEIKKLNGIGKIPKWFKSDFGALIAIVVFLTGILGPYFLIKQDIALIMQDVETVKESLNSFTLDIKQTKMDASLLGERVSKIEGALSALGITKMLKTQ